LRIKSSELINNFDLATHPLAVFSCSHEHSPEHDEYFITSQDKIRFFLEENVTDEKGVLNRPKHLAVNKIGHGMHHLEDLYKSVTFSETSQAVGKILGYEQPMVVQSMIIFKQPKVGGEVISHQDGTFLMNEPLKLYGVWIALEDCDTENGCLRFIPGSQNRPITRKMIRTHNKVSPYTTFTAPPDQFDATKFIDVPVKKGSAIIIHGQVVHRSEKNMSTRSREIYTYHVAESADSKWSPDNWLQPTDSYEFPLLYQNDK